MAEPLNTHWLITQDELGILYWTGTRLNYYGYLSDCSQHLVWCLHDLEDTEPRSHSEAIQRVIEKVAERSHAFGFVWRRVSPRPPYCLSLGR